MAQAYVSNAGQLPIDSAVDAPYAGFMNLQVPPELEAKVTDYRFGNRISTQNRALRELIRMGLEVATAKAQTAWATNTG